MTCDQKNQTVLNYLSIKLIGQMELKGDVPLKGDDPFHDSIQSCQQRNICSTVCGIGLYGQMCLSKELSFRTNPPLRVMHEDTIRASELVAYSIAWLTFLQSMSLPCEELYQCINTKWVLIPHPKSEDHIQNTILPLSFSLKPALSDQNQCPRTRVNYKLPSSLPQESMSQMLVKNYF